MPEFILDTSGRVECSDPHKPCICYAAHWEQLDAFTQGYIEAAFFTENAPGITRETETSYQDGEGYCFKDDDGDWVPTEGQFPSDYGFSDLAPEALARILEDCRKFQDGEAWKALLTDDEAREEALGVFGDAEKAGRDFWYTRNGHGCGFWDGDWPEPHATALTDACKAFREVSLYLGDDGKVRFE